MRKGDLVDGWNWEINVKSWVGKKQEIWWILRKMIIA